jgi:hypothetical protein
MGSASGNAGSDTPMFDTPPPVAKAWSPIPLTIEHPVGDRTFMPSTPPAASAVSPGELQDVGAPPAQREAPSPTAQKNDAPSTARSSTGPGPTSTVAALSPSNLPQRVRRLGPVEADKIQPTGPVAKTGSVGEPGQVTQTKTGESTTSVRRSLGATPVPPQPPPAAILAPTPNPAFDAEENGPTPVFATHVPAPESPTLDPMVVAGVQIAERGPNYANHGPSTPGGPLSLGLAPAGQFIPVEVFPNAPKAKTFGSTDPNSAYDFNNPALAGGRPVEPTVTMVIPTGVSAGSSLEAHAPMVAHVVLEESPTLGVIDWRLISLTALLAAYIPMLVRSLLGVRLSHPIGMSVLAGLMVPLSFIVVAARRPRRSTTDNRHVDLVLGIVLAIASLMSALILPKILGGSGTLWHSEWLSLPLALFAAYVLLWGVRFAWDLRNSVLIAALTSPILFIPLLGRSWSPLSGDINPLSITIANGIRPTTKTGYAAFVSGVEQSPIDARGLIDGRVLSVIFFAVAIALVLVSRVDQRTSGRGATGKSSGITQRTRKTAVIVLTFFVFWIIDLIVSALAIGLHSFVPVSFASYVTSPVVGMIPTLLTALLLPKIARKLRLFLPSKLGILNSATRLPPHGPKSRIDHLMTALVLGLLGLTAVFGGIRPSVQAVTQLPNTIDVNAVYVPSGWQPTGAVTFDEFHAYFGAHSTWVRAGLTTEKRAVLEQVNVDKISAPIDLLRTFGAPSTYSLGTFQPVDRRTLDLGDGRSGIQETYYDPATATVWSIVSILVKNDTSTTRISVSGRAAGDIADVPLPAPQALQNLTIRTQKPVPGPAQEQKIAKISSTSTAVADLMRAYVTQLVGGTVSDAQPAPAVINDIVVDDGFVQ